jgi:C-terminal processing protease CtpA/Prc
MPTFLRLYQLFEALNITNSQNMYVLSLANGIDLTVETTSNSYTLSSCFSSVNTPLYLQNNDENYWYEIIDDNIVYLQYNQCTEMEDLSFQDFNDQLFEEISDLHINKFIIDLRLNTGGSSTLIEPLIENLENMDDIQGKTYVCIGCNTFSSGMLNAIELKEDLGAILVGEPTGGKPNHYGEVQELILPNTELIVNYSTKEITTYSDSDPITLEPDFYIENYSYNCFNGIDSCIEFIKSN